MGYDRPTRRDRVRHLADSDPGAPETRRRLGRRPRLLVTAAPRIDRRTMGPRVMAVVLRDRRRRKHAYHQYLRWNRDHGLFPDAYAQSAAEALYARRPRAGDGYRYCRQRRNVDRRRLTAGISGSERFVPLDDKESLVR